MFGVAHRRIDDEREEDHAAEIIIEPVLMPQRLEIERDRGAVPPNSDTVIA
jgi:hypothetical protein